MSGLRLGLARGPIERADADIAVVSFFADERPLRGAAGRADWRLCGAVSRLIRRGKLRGDWGEAALIPSTGGLRARWVLVLGLGARSAVDAPRRREIVGVAVDRALALGVGGSVALSLPPAEADPAAVDERLDQVAQAMADAEQAARAEGQAPRSVHLRLVPSDAELPALAEALRRRAGGQGPGGLRFDPPPEAAAPSALRPRSDGGGVPRGASGPERARVPVK